MARPRSEEKRLALLNAAADTVAEHGIGAPTAQIAKRAGVAEGTLFRYFPTKDDLLNALYVHLNETMRDALVKDYRASGTRQECARALWNGYINWGLAHRAASSAVAQLAVSAVLTDAARASADALFPELEFMADALGNDIFRGQPVGFADAIFFALANTTMDFAARDPGRAESYKASGFTAIWRLYGKD